MIVNPAPGEQQSVKTITFCIKDAPEFSMLTLGSLDNDYITVTGPSGESKQISLYSAQADLSAGNFYADPGFETAGEYTITTHFPSIQYMDNSLSYQNLPSDWQEFSFTYTVAEGLDDSSSQYTPIPENAVWEGEGPGLYKMAAFTGTATIDLSAVYSSIDLTNPTQSAILMNDLGVEQGTLQTAWENTEHTRLTVTFTKNDACWRGFGTSFYVILPTAGTATLAAGGTQEIKDMRAGAWIREKGESTPSWQTKTPSGDNYTESKPTEVKAGFSSVSGMVLEVTGNLDNMTITDPQGVTTQLPAGSFNGTRTFTYQLPEGWYTVPGEYTLSFNYAPISGYSSFFTFVFPEEPYTWTFRMIEPGVSPDSPEVTIDNEPFTKSTYYLVKGTDSTVTLTSDDADTEILYKWNPGSTSTTITWDGFEKYESPISIPETGTLSYYAKKGTMLSATSSIVFYDADAALPVEELTIDPAPGKYEAWNAQNITLTNRNESFSFLGAYMNNNSVLTITKPDGEVFTTYGNNKGVSGNNQLNFDIEDTIKDPGVYSLTASFYTTFYADGTRYVIRPIHFTYEIDVETGANSIGEEHEDAIYYDLNGRKVSGELVPGIYIVREKGKVTKRLIK